MKSHNNTTETQSGGIMLKMPPEEAFYTFINNSSVSLLSDQSSFGIILKLKLNKNVESPYLKFSASNYKEPVDCILIKLVVLYNTENTEHYEDWYINGQRKHIDTEENFMKEVNIQTNVFFETMEYLEPICPATVYANVLKTKAKMTHFLDILNKNTNTKSTHLNDILTSFDIRNDLIWLGVFGMEIDPHYVSLYEFRKYDINPNDEEDLNYYRWVEQMAKLQVLNLAMKTGYSQNDFHHGNFLIHQTYRGMYDKLDGKVLIIDFGLASELSPTHIKEINKNYSRNKFTEALKVFKGLKRSDGIVIDDYFQYWWLYNQERVIENPDSFYDSIMHRLKNKEDIAISKRIHKYDKKHQANPDVYPLLPLSNAIKNQFYQGMIESDQMQDNPLTSVSGVQSIASIPCQKGQCETSGLKKNGIHSKSQTTRKSRYNTNRKTRNKSHKNTPKNK